MSAPICIRNQTLGQRYLTFVENLATAHFGNSSAALAQGLKLPVWSVIRTPLRNSVILASVTLILFVPLCLLLGTTSALRAGRKVDHAISVPALVASAMPEFLVGDSLDRGLLHAAEPVSTSRRNRSWGDAVHPPECARPACTDVVERQSRPRGQVGTCLNDRSPESRLRQDGPALRTARAGGLRCVCLARNALGQGIQAVAQTSQSLLGGIIITESVFNYPGIGNKLVQAVQLRDIQEIGVIAMILATTYITINILADLAVMLVVPKLRTSA